jgi:hypothetical protein
VPLWIHINIYFKTNCTDTFFPCQGICVCIAAYLLFSTISYTQLLAAQFVTTMDNPLRRLFHLPAGRLLKLSRIHCGFTVSASSVVVCGGAGLEAGKGVEGGCPPKKHSQTPVAPDALVACHVPHGGWQFRLASGRRVRQVFPEFCLRSSVAAGLSK